MSSESINEKESDEWTDKDSAELAHFLLVSGWIIAGNLTASSIAIYIWPNILLEGSIIDKIFVVITCINTFAGTFWILVYVLSSKE